MSTMAQPIQKMACMTTTPAGLVTDQIVCGIGRHCQYRSTSARLASST